MAILQRGTDIEIDVTNSTALDLVDAYAIHLRYSDQESEIPVAKLTNTATTGYSVRLFDVLLSAGTFTMKLDKDFTAGLSPNKTLQAMIFTQITDTDYTDNDFRPASQWTDVGVTSDKSILTVTLGA